MKKLIVFVMVLMMLVVGVTLAENVVPFSEWLEAQSAVAEQAVVQDEPLVAEGVPLVPFTLIGVGSRGDDVIQLQEKLIELGFLTGKADGIFGAGTEAAVKAMQKALGWEETGIIASADELNTMMGVEPGNGINLAVGTSDEWSEWMSPEYDVNNRSFVISTAYLGDKQTGDTYTCQLEIEFLNVTATETINDERKFGFCTQGKADDDWEEWSSKNVWNRSLITIDEVPMNGIYKYVSTARITDKGMNTQKCEIGFRCDYWASGQFRVRRVKVEKGALATEWSISPHDIGDGVNLAIGTSNEWSEWMSPEYDVNNRSFVISTAYLGDKQTGDAYTCQLEIEFMNVTATETIEDERKFGFCTQGKADDDWEEWSSKNVWNRSLITIDEVPMNGIYKYVSIARITDKGMNTQKCEIGFRCDYWASGQFRVRRVKVEKGMIATTWSPSY